MKHRKISIDQLRVGMFIHEMDLPWLQNPFFRSRLAINSESDIKKLKDAGAKAITIDLTQGCDIEEEQQEENTTHPDSEPKTSVEPQQTAPPPNQEPPIFNAVDPNKPLTTQALKINTEAARLLKSHTMASIHEIGQQLERGEGLAQDQLDELVEHLVENIQKNQQAILSLLISSESHNILTGHLYNVMVLVLSLGAYLNLSEEDVTLLGQTALLHDIGWSKLPAYLLNKGREFSAAENKLAKQSNGLTESLLKSAKDLNPRILSLLSTYNAVITEHKANTNQNNQLILGRVLALTDEYEELTHALKGKSGVLPAKAMKVLYQKEHRHFDDKLISALVRMMGIYPLGSAVQLKSGEKGMIVRVRPDNPLNSQVIIKYDADGKRMKEDRIVTLGAQQGYEVSTFIDPSEQGIDPDGILVMNEQG